MYPDVLSIEINALTPIWTGDENGSGDKLCPTGLIGSFRWWYEALIRGLDGYACDPTSEKSCRIDENKLKNEDEIKKSICPACYLFGCTGWQRKFRFEIRKIKNGSIGPLKTSSIKANEKLMLCFIPLKEFDMVEKSLLYTALKIVSGYGSIGVVSKIISG
ncbi:MAG: type III-B CRISPR module RAMP protein Cmr1 [Fibrobacter sp.]|nr:type III-B CRISPR module RAMP protein Cmr1 [Fibrobacter sp.]